MPLNKRRRRICGDEVRRVVVVMATFVRQGVDDMRRRVGGLEGLFEVLDERSVGDAFDETDVIDAEGRERAAALVVATAALGQKDDGDVDGPCRPTSAPTSASGCADRSRGSEIETGAAPEKAVHQQQRQRRMMAGDQRRRQGA